MSLTRSRTIQYVGILLALGLLAAGYWYFSARASTKLNKTPTGSLTNGLVGYWTFDGADTTATTVSDKSGNGYSATRNGGTSIVAGRIDQALSLNGDDLTNVTATGSSLNNLTQFTACVWVNPSALVNVDSDPASYILSKVWFLSFDNTGQPQFAVSTNAAYPRAYGMTDLVTNRWQHLCGVSYGVGTEPKLFLDGIDVSTDTDFGSGTQTDDSSFPLTFGSQHDNDSYVNYQGKIDEIRIYNRTLSAAEIGNLYDMGKVTVGTRPGDDSLEEGLAGYWKLDEGTGTSTTADASGNGNALTMANMESGDWVTGHIGPYALDFDGTDEYLAVSDPASGVLDFGSGQAFTYSGWFYRDTGTTYDPLIFKAASDTSQGYGIHFDDAGLLNAFLNDASDDCAWYVNTGSLTGAWHHYALSVTGNHVAKLYLDGSMISENDCSISGDLANSDSLAIGVAITGSVVYFDGKLDETRAYRRALSNDEIRRLFLATHPDDPNTNLVSHWTFDGADVSGTTAFDRGRSGNNGTLTGGPVVAPGRMGQALDFDGSDDSVSVSDASALDVGDTADLSLSGWFSRDSFTTDDTLLAKRNGQAAGDTGYVLYIDDATDQLIFEVSDGTDEYSLASTATFTAAGWHHYAITWDQDSAANSEIFIDGVANSATDTGTIGNIGDLSNALTLRTGAESDDGNPFDGKLDEVRVYNAVLTQDQVTDIHRAAGGKAIVSSSGNDTLRSGLVGLWSMDGQDVNWADTTTEVKDDSGNANHGDTTNMTAASVAPGRVGQALDFSESGDRAVLYTSAAFDNLDTKTISLWLKPSELSTYHGIMGRGTWAFQICSNDATDCNGTAGHLLYYHAFSGTDGKWRLGANSVTVGSWAHVVIAYDRTSTSNDPVIYVNGSSQTVTELSAPTGTADSETNDLAIGYDGYVDSPGLIDDVRIYNRILSSGEVTQLYNMGR